MRRIFATIIVFEILFLILQISTLNILLKSISESEISQELAAFEIQLKQIARAIDVIWLFSEKDIDQHIKTELPKLKNMVDAAWPDPLDIDVELLTEELPAYGFNDFYILDETDTVVLTSYAPDLGFSLSESSEDYAGPLNELRDNPRVAMLRISLPKEGGTPKKFAYIPLADTKYILEISININDRNYNDFYDEIYGFIDNEYISAWIEQDRYLLDFDIYRANWPVYSFFNPGKKLDPEVKKKLNISENTELSQPDGILEIFIPFKLRTGEDELHSIPYLLYGKFDISPIRQKTRQFVLIAFSAEFVLFTALGFIILFLLNRRVFQPVNYMSELLHKRQWDEDTPIESSHPGAPMEIREIYTAISGYQHQINSQRRHLERVNAELEDRVKERTRDLEASIDALKRSQTKIGRLERNRVYDQMSIGLAHELNTPLGICITALSLQQDVLRQLLELSSWRGEDNDKARDFIQQGKAGIQLISTNLNHSVKIVARLKELSGFDLEDKTSVFSMETLMEDLMIFCSHEYGLKRSSFHFLGSELKIRSQKEVLLQALVQLVSNSVSHSGKSPGKLKISVCVHRIENAGKNLLRFTFSDNGRGIPNDIEGRLFELFFTDQRKQRYMGIGLSMVQNYIEERLGGKIYNVSGNGELIPHQSCENCSADGCPVLQENGAVFCIELPENPQADEDQPEKKRRGS